MDAFGRLVDTKTADGIRLHGFLQSARCWEAERRREPIDLGLLPPRHFSEGSSTIWLIVHGVAGNFYGSTLLQSLADGLLESGCDVLRVNTRGRDPVANLPLGGGYDRQGAAFEMISDAATDFEAWIRFVNEMGYRSIGLMGHSLGALKVAMASTRSFVTSVQRIVCISPPRLSRSVLANDPNYGGIYQEQWTEARRLVDHGTPEALMTIRYPQPMLISAATFLDKYGGEDHDYMRWVEQIELPSLWCFGQLEVEGKRASFRGCDRELAHRVAAMAQHRVLTIPGADHAYTEGRLPLNRAIRDWLNHRAS